VMWETGESWGRTQSLPWEVVLRPPVRKGNQKEMPRQRRDEIRSAGRGGETIFQKRFRHIVKKENQEEPLSSGKGGEGAKARSVDRRD